jgi:hypothetical protein
MARRAASLIAGAAVAALITAGCGGSSAAGSAGVSVTSHPHSSPQAPPPDSSQTTLKSVTVLGSDTGPQVKRYLADLAAVRQQIQIANRAAGHEVSIASSGDYPALAADSRTVATHLGRAAGAARRVQAPQGLERAHANLVRALTTGRRMADRLAVLYLHIGPGSPREYKQHVLPLEKLSVRLANHWYRPMQVAMTVGNVREPGWVGHLFDWT